MPGLGRFSRGKPQASTDVTTDKNVSVEEENDCSSWMSNSFLETTEPSLLMDSSFDSNPNDTVMNDFDFWNATEHPQESNHQESSSDSGISIFANNITTTTTNNTTTTTTNNNNNNNNTVEENEIEKEETTAKKARPNDTRVADAIQENTPNESKIVEPRILPLLSSTTPATSTNKIVLKTPKPPRRRILETPVETTSTTTTTSTVEATESLLPPPAVTPSPVLAAAPTNTGTISIMNNNNNNFEDLHTKFLTDLCILQDLQGMTSTRTLQLESIFATFFSQILQEQSQHLDLIEELEAMVIEVDHDITNLLQDPSEEEYTRLE